MRIGVAAARRTGMSENTRPQPDPALERLDRFVGRCMMEGHLVGLDETTITGETIGVSYSPLDATFTGSWREDGTFSGGWRPIPGVDETVNVPDDIGGHRLG
jgi:hypothetical protein